MGGEGEVVGCQGWLQADTVCVRHTFCVRHALESHTVDDLPHLPLENVESDYLVIQFLWVLPSLDAAKQMILTMLPKAQFVSLHL